MNWISTFVRTEFRDSLSTRHPMVYVSIVVVLQCLCKSTNVVKYVKEMWGDEKNKLEERRGQIPLLENEILDFTDLARPMSSQQQVNRFFAYCKLRRQSDVGSFKQLYVFISSDNLTCCNLKISSKPILSILNKGLHPVTPILNHSVDVYALLMPEVALHPSPATVHLVHLSITLPCQWKNHLSNIISFFTLFRLTLTQQRFSLMSFYAHLYLNRHNSK